VTQRTANFLGLALDDYRAARLLLRKGLLAQGVALASTAVEKELKAVLALKGFSPRSICTVGFSLPPIFTSQGSKTRWTVTSSSSLAKALIFVTRQSTALVTAS